MRNVPIGLVVASLLTLIVASPLLAETHFVRGVSDGLRTYAVVSRNGVEYRTDELGARVNAGIWNELSTADRRALISTYGWDLGSRADHFGNTTNDIATWINDQQGWTAAAEALKARHATKAFPTLTPVFGPGTTLELPDFYCANPEIINSAEYKEAMRLSLEVQADYAVGKQVYDMLVNAKWDQVSIAVKTISEPLIKMIVDNFITGFVTNGASKISELAATAYGFRNDLKDFIAGRMQTGATPPTPIDLINRLEKYIADMETTAETAVTLVNQKKDRLNSLATTLKQRDAAKTAEKKDAATAVRTALQDRVSATPAPAVTPTFNATNPEGTPDEQKENRRVQMEAWLLANVRNPKLTLENDKGIAGQAVVDKYSGTITAAGAISYPGIGYAPDSSNGFIAPYYEVIDQVATVEQWAATDIPNAVKDIDRYKATLAGAPAEVNGVIDAVLGRINSLHSLTLSMDAYESILGYKPSATITYNALRDFTPLVNVLATPDKKVEDLTTEMTDQKAIADEIKNALPNGIDKRKAWMQDEVRQYDSLRFNFENSFSYIIAGIRQVERLHQHPYFRRQTDAVVCYGSACVYRYNVDVAGINAGIAAIADRAGRESARMQAVDELLRLRAEETKLIQRIEIAQNSHINDSVEMTTFWDALASRYRYPDFTTIINEFQSVTGKTMVRPYDLWDALAPDATYYYTGTPQSGSWIRNRSNLTAVWADPMQNYTGPVIDLVSGKIPEYWELLDLYRGMAANKSQYLAMSTTDFDAFMTSMTMKIGSAPVTGTYITAFDIAKVYGVDWPCWQLIMKTRYRQEDLNAEYRYHYIPNPVAWDIDGFVRTVGSAGMQSLVSTSAIAEPDAVPPIGLPDVTVLLNGYLTTATKTATDGSFRFEWIGSGDFTLSGSGQGYQYPGSARLTITAQNATVNLTAAETAASGYSISGTVKDGAGTAIEGVSIALTSPTGEPQTVVSGADGVYRFFRIPAGTWSVRPVGGEWSFAPASRSVTLPASATSQDFAGTAAVASPTGLSVVLSGTGVGRVTSTPAGIDCPGTCWAAFANGTTVVLTPAPQSGSALSAWHGRCSGAAGCSVAMSGAASVMAVFNSTAPADATPPTITTFTLPSTSSSSTVALSFSAIDNAGVTGYLVSTNSATPAAGDPKWQASPPTTYVFIGSGPKILYGWAKDAGGNVSVAASATVTVSATAGASGDANGDLVVTVGDIFYLINHLFANGPAPIGSADVNGDLVVSVGDIFYLINYLFAGGPAPR